MSRSFRRYCFDLAERLKMSLKDVLSLGSDEISEWMAYDLTCDKTWQTEYKKQKEIERQRALSNNAKARMFKQLFRGNRK